MQHAKLDDSATAQLADGEPPAVGLSPPGESRQRPAGGRATLAVNVILFLAAGTLLCFWFWRNSDWFEELGAVLTLSGALSWLAMALKLVPEAKVSALQEVFFERAFEHRGATIWHVAAFVVVLAGTFCFATVQIEPVHEAVDRPVVVSRIAGESPPPEFWSEHLAADEFAVLQPGKTLRVVVPVWWQPRTRVVVAVGGYPEKTITLSPWERHELIAPSSFRRSVVLLRPTADLMDQGLLAERKLVVMRMRSGEGAVTRELAFSGHAVWVGCNDHVEVPAFWREAWARETGWPERMAKWLFPKALTFPGDLRAGDVLQVEVRGPAGLDWELKPAHVVGPLSSRTEFLPEIIKVGRE